eukprot:SAG11_NODE_27115_length_336_cov_2.033755_1_plen_58_part_10
MRFSTARVVGWCIAPGIRGTPSVVVVQPDGEVIELEGREGVLRGALEGALCQFGLYTV